MSCETLSPCWAPHCCRILSSIYERYTARPPPARYGSHWEDVGFQGKDPATDLRGCGMLGLLQLLHLWDAGPSNARAIYRLSRDADQEFPLAVVAMNVTKWSLQVLRSGELNAAANKSQKLIQEFNKFYVGVFYFFYGHWVEKQATMRDSGHVMKVLKSPLETVPPAPPTPCPSRRKGLFRCHELLQKIETPKRLDPGRSSQPT